MKTKADENLTPVYKKLARKIEQENDGSEGFWEEAEITFNNKNFWVTFTLRRETLDRHFNFDEEPFGEVRTTLSITDCLVTDNDGEPVSTSFDPSEVEGWFNDYANKP